MLKHEHGVQGVFSIVDMRDAIRRPHLHIELVFVCRERVNVQKSMNRYTNPYRNPRELVLACAFPLDSGVPAGEPHLSA